MKRINNFNIICLCLCILFLAGSVYPWRGVWTSPVENDIGEVKMVDKREKKQEVAEVIEDVSLDEELAVQEKIVYTGINLPVPFTSQAPEKNWDQPWQDACEEAAVLMLDAYYKDYTLSPLFTKDEITKMVEWEEDQGWGTSIEMLKVKKLVEYYLHKNVSIVSKPTIERIKRYVDSGQPVLVVAYGKDLPNPNFRNGGPEYHALIIRGYTDEKFITNDPGTQFGKNFSYLYDDLLNAIHDWNGGDVENGEKVVLVVE